MEISFYAFCFSLDATVSPLAWCVLFYRTPPLVVCWRFTYGLQPAIFFVFNGINYSCRPVIYAIEVNRKATIKVWIKNTEFIAKRKKLKKYEAFASTKSLYKNWFFQDTYEAVYVILKKWKTLFANIYKMSGLQIIPSQITIFAIR